MLYYLARLVFFIFFKTVLSFKVSGQRNIPGKGAFIFVSNHSSYLDPILLGTSSPRSLYYMAREDLFKRPCFAWMMREAHAFPVKRSGGDLRAIKDALRILERGKPLVMFPEGARSKDKELKKGKPGLGFIVARSGVPVIPAYIDGAFDVLPRGTDSFKRYPVSVYIGEPVDFARLGLAKKDKGYYHKMSDEIMRRIAQLKEEYADKTC